MRPVDSDNTEAKRMHIIQAAARCCAKYGVAKTTSRDICKESSMSSSHIYYYFDNKDAILRAVLEHNFFVSVISRVEHMLETLDLASAIIEMHNQAEAERLAWGLTPRVRIELQCYFVSDEHFNDASSRMKERLATAIKTAMTAAMGKGKLPAGLDLDRLTEATILIWNGLSLSRLYPDFDLDAMRPVVESLVDPRAFYHDAAKKSAVAGR